MPEASPTAGLFSRAADKIVDTFAERRQDGDIDTDSLRLVLADKTTHKAPCIRGQEEATEGPDAEGNWVKERRVVVDAKRSHFPGLTAVPMKAIAYLGSEKFAIANSGSKLDETWLTLALVRSTMTENNPLRR